MLPDVNDLMKAVKRAALDVVEASKPVNVCFGKVVSDEPIKIKIEQKILLGESQLIIPRNVTDFSVTVQRKDGSSEEMIIKNSLRNDDKVILIRQQEGQKYVVIDRIGVM